MRWKRKSFIALFGFLAMAELGCSNPATRPTPGFVELALLPATSVALPAPSAFLMSLRISGNAVDLQEIRIAVKDLELESGGDLETDFPGPFVVRLIQGGQVVDEALPSFGTANVPDGSYTKLELSLEKLPSGQIPAEAQLDPFVNPLLVDQSMLIEGSFLESPQNDIDGNGAVSMVPFRFLSDNGNSVEITTPTPFNLAAGVNFLFIAFKVQLWFDSDVVQALQNLNPSDFQGGMILLSDQASQQDIRSAVKLIEEKVESSLRFAPSDNDQFEESDVDEDSSSSPL